MAKLAEFGIAVETVGHGLQRPECVVCTRAGRLYAADWEGQGGVAIVEPDGSVSKVLAKGGFQVRPNGIALDRDGSFLLAHLGPEDGGVFRLTRDGELRPFVVEVDGVVLPPSNFFCPDGAGGAWITVSTRVRPRAAAYRRDVSDGFVVYADRAGARVAVDGLGYTNECGIAPGGRWLYVNETFGRRLSRFAIGEGGALGRRETVTEFGAGTYPDGIAFDIEGHVWITSIVSNRVIRVAPDGTQTVILEDCDDAHIAWVEEAFLAGTMGRPHLDNAGQGALKNISSLAFGGPDLRTAHLGCLLDDRVARFRSAVAGAPPLHWTYDG